MNCANPTCMVCYEYTDGKKRLISEAAAASQNWNDSIVIDPITRHYYRKLDGKRLDTFDIPCGRCLLCRQRRGFELGIRARCEAACYGVNDSCFITLTVSDDNIEAVFPNGKLRHLPFQLFAKRLRKKIGPFRYMMCGEYGDHSKRPHYHIIIFGHNFLDSYFDSSGVFHGSKILEEVWQFGHVMVSRLNDNRIMYVAGYILKPGLDDISDSQAKLFEKKFDLKLRNYVRWSRRPGLGAAWIDRFASSVYKYAGKDFDLDLDRVVSAVVWRGKLVPFACRYFDERLRLQDEKKYDILKSYRRMKVGSSFFDTTHSDKVREVALVGLKNKLEALANRVANRTRDLS